MFITRGPTDIKNVYEFTDWEGVKIFQRIRSNVIYSVSLLFFLQI